MTNCSEDIVAHHNDKVTLPQSERTAMRERRDANRKRLKDGLKRLKKPAPAELKSQGSYAMKTMVQDFDKDYDIDDGVYFSKEDLKDSSGGELTALAVREMVRDAVDDNSFKRSPEIRAKCVRVYYDAGYHVDIPVYRITKDGQKEIYELAADNWMRSDARDVTEWFENQNQNQSADDTNGRQLRRITRDLKKFARSRPDWKNKILSGFGITKLVTECFKGNIDREDTALYDTMKEIRDRLNRNLVIDHPIPSNDPITKGPNDPKAIFLRDKLSDALDCLQPVFVQDCTRKNALSCWDSVFKTDYFSKRLEDEESNAEEAAGDGLIVTAGLLKTRASTAAAQSAVRKEGGGRYA